MKKLLTWLSFSLTLTWFTSCQQEFQETDSETDLVEVTINLSGLDITTEMAPVFEASASGLTRASDKSATEAKITNIDLKALDAEGNAVETVSQDSADADFGTLSMKLPVGTYTFVAIANDQTVADITSATSATIEGSNCGFLYSCVQSVTLSGNTTQTVSLDMGKRKNSSLRIKITDTTPTDVEAIQFIVSPSANLATALTFSPATGFVTDTWRYEKVFTKTANKFTTFTNVSLVYDFMLTAAETRLDVTINGLSAEDTQTHQRTILYTRKLSGITFKQGERVTATGTFFSVQSSGAFLFDTSVPNTDISLD